MKWLLVLLFGQTADTLKKCSKGQERRNLARWFEVQKSVKERGGYQL
jgi:hypothetical protein